MRRWMLYLIGAVLLVEPVIFRQVKPQDILGALGSAGALDHLPAWMRASIFAGVYLIEWGPVLAGLLIIHYAHRSQTQPDALSNPSRSRAVKPPLRGDN
jgi:hypothetical protein